MSEVNKFKKQLLDYYFGVISDEDRIVVEEKLLENPAYLMSFIALKRSIEVEDPSLSEVPDHIRIQLKQEIFNHNQSIKRVIINQKWSFAQGAMAVAATVIVTVSMIYFFHNQNAREDIGQNNNDTVLTERLTDYGRDESLSLRFL